MEQLKGIIANSIPATMTFETSEDILRFNDCRCLLERRLRDVDPTTAAALKPVVSWMRNVILKWAPDLLNDVKEEEIQPQLNSAAFSK